MRAISRAQLAVGATGGFRRPVLALPVNQVRGWLVAHAFPPDVAVIGQRHVGEDGVTLQRVHAVRVGLEVRARGHTEIAGFGVDGVQPAILVGLDPGDVVPDGADLPAAEARRRHQHRKVGLAAGAGEGRGDVVLASFGRGHAKDQHVLSQPALFAAHGRGDAQRKALLAQQRVAAITRAVAPDLLRLWVVHDVFGLVARPGHVFLAALQRRADAVHTRHEVAVLAQQVEHWFAHACHEPHVHGDIGAVGQLDTDVRNG